MPSARDLLKFVPAPLLGDLVSGRWLPIVGAGLSRNARMPANRTAPPNWTGLGEALASELPSGYAADGPLETLSAYEHAFGRVKLIERVLQALGVGVARPGRVHEAFCELPFDVLVTTNVDHLLEIEYRRRFGALLTVSEEQQLRMANPYSAPTLVKFHGDLHHPASLILTERDYDAALPERPLMATWLANQLISRTGVMVGYSLDDPDFRAILHQVRSRLGSSPPDLYVIEVALDPVRVDRYQRRGVRVINLPRTAAGYDILIDFFEQLGSYWQDTLSRDLGGTSGAIQAVLRVGRRVDNVVLVLVSAERLSFYHEYVFPQLVARGLMPISPEDVAGRRGSTVAQLDALLRAAGVIVVEVDGVESAELRRATTAVGKRRVIRVLSLPDSEEDEETIGSPGDDDWDVFGEQLAVKIEEARSSQGGSPSPTSQFRLLLGQDQTRAAALLGFATLESRLNSALGEIDLAQSSLFPESVSSDSRKFRRVRNFRDFLEQAAIRIGLPISPGEQTELVHARNALVHGSEDMPRRRLDWIVGILNRLFDYLDTRDVELQEPDN